MGRGPQTASFAVFGLTESLSQGLGLFWLEFQLSHEFRECPLKPFLTLALSCTLSPSLKSVTRAKNTDSPILAGLSAAGACILAAQGPLRQQYTLPGCSCRYANTAVAPRGSSALGKLDAGQGGEDHGSFGEGRGRTEDVSGEGGVYSSSSSMCQDMIPSFQAYPSPFHLFSH